MRSMVFLFTHIAWQLYFCTALDWGHWEKLGVTLTYFSLNLFLFYTYFTFTDQSRNREKESELSEQGAEVRPFARIWPDTRAKGGRVLNAADNLSLIGLRCPCRHTNYATHSFLKFSQNFSSCVPSLDQQTDERCKTYPQFQEKHHNNSCQYQAPESRNLSSKQADRRTVFLSLSFLFCNYYGFIVNLISINYFIRYVFWCGFLTFWNVVICWVL